mmetsp:Transcript_55504/g.110252  ORF Transcript_55504/g.110252 Transcript_55504/m.110252 type:complete len:203 (-) Transcript_55504:33-641(-)
MLRCADLSTALSTTLTQASSAGCSLASSIRRRRDGWWCAVPHHDSMSPFVGGCAPASASLAHALSKLPCSTPASGHASKHQSGTATSAYFGVVHIERTRRRGRRALSSSGTGCDCHRSSSTPSFNVCLTMHRSPVWTTIGGKSRRLPEASRVRSIRVIDWLRNAQPPWSSMTSAPSMRETTIISAFCSPLPELRSLELMHRM